MSLWILSFLRLRVLSLFVLSQAVCVFAYCPFFVLSQAVCIFVCYPCLSELVGSLSVLSNCLYLAKLPVSLITVLLSLYILGQVIWTVKFDSVYSTQVIWTVKFDSVYSTLSHLDR